MNINRLQYVVIFFSILNKLLNVIIVNRIWFSDQNIITTLNQTGMIVESFFLQTDCKIFDLQYIPILVTGFTHYILHTTPTEIFRKFLVNFPNPPYTIYHRHIYYSRFQASFSPLHIGYTISRLFPNGFHMHYSIKNIIYNI